MVNETSAPAKVGKQAAGENTAATGNKSTGFTDEERAAMEERARELKAEARADKNKAAGESDVLAKIATAGSSASSRAQPSSTRGTRR